MQEENNQKKYEQAFTKDDTPDKREQIVRALVNEGVTLEEQGKPEEAIAVYDEINRCFGEDNTPGVRREVIRALINKGTRLELQYEFEGAVDVFYEIDRRFGEDDLDVHREVVRALIHIGDSLGEMGDTLGAIDVYDEIDHRFSENDTPGVRKLVVSALIDKGHIIAYGESSQREDPCDYEGAIRVYDEIVHRFGEDDTLGVRELVAQALNSKGWILKTQSKFEEEFVVYDEIVRRFGKDETPGIRKLVALALRRKGEILEQRSKSEEAFAVYDEIVRINTSLGREVFTMPQQQSMTYAQAGGWYREQATEIVKALDDSGLTPHMKLDKAYKLREAQRYAAMNALGDQDLVAEFGAKHPLESIDKIKEMLGE
jgi:tetratricopeptide (TPR) repeat protein